MSAAQIPLRTHYIVEVATFGVVQATPGIEEGTAGTNEGKHDQTDASRRESHFCCLVFTRSTPSFPLPFSPRMSTMG